MAGGSEVDPGHVYQVGEQGPEYFRPATRGRIVPNDELGGGGPNYQFSYTIDARGTDPVLTDRRVRAAIIASHNSSVGNSLLANEEKLKRTPQK